MEQDVVFSAIQLEERIERTKEMIADYEWRMAVHGPQFDTPQNGNGAARAFHQRRRDECMALLTKLQGELISLMKDSSQAPVAATTDHAP